MPHFCYCPRFFGLVLSRKSRVPPDDNLGAGRSVPLFPLFSKAAPHYLRITVTSPNDDFLNE